MSESQLFALLREKEVRVSKEPCRPRPSFISDRELLQYMNIYTGILTVYSKFLQPEFVLRFIEDSLHQRRKYICGMIMDREQFEVFKAAAACELLALHGELGLFG